MAVAGYDIRVNGGAWMPVGDVLSKFVRGLDAETYGFHLRARDVAGNASGTTGPVFGTATPLPSGPPLLDGLVAAYPLDEASGNAVDAHGSNDLTDNNTVTSGTGIVSGSRAFASANTEFFSLADNADLSMGDIDFTISCWVKVTSFGSERVFIAKGDDITSTSTLEYALHFRAAISRFVFRVRGSSTNTQVAANNFGAPNTGVWYHILAWHDAANDQIGISVNNGTPNTAAHSLGAADGAGTFRIGWDGVAGRYHNGELDNIYIWKRLLTDDEKTWWYNSGAGRQYSSLVATQTIEITNEALPDGSVGEAYSHTLTTEWGTGTETFAVHLGALPSGLSLNTGTGEISGTPTTTGLASVIFSVTDDNGTAYKYLTLLVDEPPSSYLLDDITATPVSAVSLRKLRSAYAGSAIRVQRGDASELDIGFDSNGNLDKEAALAFGRDLTVIGFYDQSSSENNYTDYGNPVTLVYDKLSGRAALDFGDEDNDAGFRTDSTVAFTQMQAFFAFYCKTTSPTQRLVDVEQNKFNVIIDEGAVKLFNVSNTVSCGPYAGGATQLTANFRTGDDRVYIDGVEKPAVDGGSGSLNAGDSSGTGDIVLGRRHLSGSSLVGYISEAIFFAEDNVSSDDKAEIESSQSGHWITPNPSPVLMPYSNIVTLEGDSRTFGLNSIGSQNAPIDTPLRTLLGSDWMVRDVSASTQNLIADYTPQAATQVDPFFDSRMTKNVVVVWGIVNDLHDDTGETLDENDLYSALTAYVQARQAEGFEVVVCTDLPWTHATYTTSNQRTVILPAYNALVVANSAGADAVVDFSDDPDLTDADDTTYFDVDKLHIVQAGAAKCAALIATAVEGL